MVETAIRRVTLPAVDTIKDRLFGGFAKSHSTEDEYAATVYCTEEQLQEILGELGFSSSLFSALKVRFDGNVEDGSWVRRESLLADRQLHVVTHRREDSEGVDTYAHSEYSTLTHPVKHYRKKEYDAEAGIEEFRNSFEDYRRQVTDPPRFEVHPPHHRSWAWALHLLSFVSTPAAVRIGHAIDQFESRLSSIVKATRRLSNIGSTH